MCSKGNSDYHFSVADNVSMMAPFEFCSHFTVANKLLPYSITVAMELSETLDTLPSLCSKKVSVVDG
jgi:hypothetical protein